MSWFTNMLSGGVDKIVDSVGTAVDSIVTNDEERLILRNELAKIQLEAKQIEQAKQYLQDTDYKVLPDYDGNTDGVLEARAEARALIRGLEG